MEASLLTEPHVGPVNRLFVLDLDRTVLDTERVQEALKESLVSQGVVDLVHFDEMQQKDEQAGGSFDTIRYLVDHNIDYVAPIRHFVETYRHENFLEPDADKVLGYLRSYALPYMFLTYGGRRWQRAKLQLSGLAAEPYVITSERHKGHFLADAQQEDGRLQLEEVQNVSGGIVEAYRVTLVDDKAMSFTGLERLGEWADGLHVLPSDDRELMPSQRGTLPQRVRPVIGMKGVLFALAA